MLQLLITAVASLAGALVQEGDKDVLRRLSRAFQEDDVAGWQLAVEAARGLDSAAAAQAIVEAHGVLEEEAADLERQIQSLRQGSRRGARELQRRLQGLQEMQQSLCATLRGMSRADSLDSLSSVMARTSQAPAVRLAAMQAVLAHPLDTPAQARTLVETYGALENEALSIESERARVIEKEDRRPIAELRRRLDPLREMQELVRDTLLGMEDPQAQRWLFQELAGDDKVAMSLRMPLVRHLADGAAVQPEDLVEALARSRKPGELALLLNGIARRGTKAAGAGDKAIQLLNHSDATVREAAAWALAALALPRSIAPLLERMGAEAGRTQRRMAAALEVLTRQKLGVSVVAWQRWFEEEGATYTSGAVPLGGGETSLGPDTRGGYFHGIPQEGHSIVYVIDVSGSMRESMETGDRYRPGRPAAPGEQSRLQACKDELVRALGALPEDAEFNIVYYSDVAKLYGKGLMTAGEKKVETAQEWVRSLEADGATNIYDGLERAFTLAGRGVRDRYYDAQVETVFLLTDGKPQLPNGQWDDTNRIREAVKRWNPYGKVVVHTIGLGEGVNAEFLKALAAENGGQFVEL